MAYFVDIMRARARGAGADHDRPISRLPGRFDDLEDAAEFALTHLEERDWLLTEWSFNIVDEAGRIVVTADDPEPSIPPTMAPSPRMHWWRALWR